MMRIASKLFVLLNAVGACTVPGNCKTMRATLTATNTPNVPHIVKDLNRALQIELNILVEHSSRVSDEVEVWLPQLHMPKLIVASSRAAAGMEIYSKFSARCLTIAVLSEAVAAEVAEMVRQILWRLHFTDVLFIFKDTTIQRQGIQQLFARCWKHGFTNVLVVLHNGTLLTYQPFPRLAIVPLHKLSAHYNKAHLGNFQRYPLRTPISNSSPRCYHYKDQRGQLVNGGYFYKIVRTFIEHYNGTFEEAEMPIYDLNLNDILSGFDTGQIDIVANMLYMYPNYAHSNVIRNLNVYIMVPNAKLIPHYFYLVKPLTGSLWAALLLTIGYIVLLMTLIYWWQERVVDFSISLLQVLNVLLFLPNLYRRIRTRVQLVIFAILLSAGFLLTNLYMANLSSMLTSKLYQPQINTIADIGYTDLVLPQTELDIAYLYSLSGIPEIIINRLFSTTPQAVHNLRRDLNTSFMHSGIEDKVQFFLYQQKFLKVPYFKKIDEVLYTVPIFIPLAHGSPFLQLLNRYLRHISDAGILQKIISDNEEDGILSGEIKFFKSEETNVSSLTLAYFRLLFIFWGFSLVSALLCFSLENLNFRYSLYKPPQ